MLGRQVQAFAWQSRSEWKCIFRCDGLNYRSFFFFLCTDVSISLSGQHLISFLTPFVDNPSWLSTLMSSPQGITFALFLFSLSYPSVHHELPICPHTCPDTHGWKQSKESDSSPSRQLTSFFQSAPFFFPGFHLFQLYLPHLCHFDFLLYRKLLPVDSAANPLFFLICKNKIVLIRTFFTKIPSLQELSGLYSCHPLPASISKKREKRNSGQLLYGGKQAKESAPGVVVYSWCFDGLWSFPGMPSFSYLYHQKLFKHSVYWFFHQIPFIWISANVSFTAFLEKVSRSVMLVLTYLVLNERSVRLQGKVQRSRLQLQPKLLLVSIVTELLHF